MFFAVSWLQRRRLVKAEKTDDHEHHERSWPCVGFER